MIYLHTLGDTLIKVGEKEVRPSAPLVFAALLYLSVERGRRVPRAALQELFFPESDERSGSHNVRQLLYKLRQLGVTLVTDQSFVTFQADELLDDCAGSTMRGWSDYQAAGAARGFVPDYQPFPSKRFEEWLEAQRTIVASRVRLALLELLRQKRAAANWPSLAAVAQSLLAIDPLNEEATLSLAEATAALGAKRKALDMLSSYEAETGSTLRLPPSLLRKRISEQLEALPQCDSAPLLLGRSEELSSILSIVLDRRRDTHAVVLIVGEAGIGKTRLLEEAVNAGSMRGIRPYLVRCKPHYDSRPLSVFLDLVPQLLQSPGALGVSPESLTQLRRLVHKDPTNDHLLDLEDDTARSEPLRRAITDLIDAVGNEQSILLAVEDAHWSDSESLNELRHIATSLPDVPILVTSRSADRLKTRFADIATVSRLAPLSDTHMEELSALLLGASDDCSTRRWCVSVASGNPLFLRMVCSHVSQTGHRSVPRDLTSVITSRLLLLPESLLRTLQYVALLGSYATIASLRDALVLEQQTFIACISELEDQGYIAAADNRVYLIHDLVAEMAMTLLTPVTKCALHAHVASILERRFEDTGNTSTLWDCAEQWRLSGESAKSLALLRRCAAHASAVGQSGRALEMLDRARPLAKERHELIQLLTEMVVAAKAAGQLTDVLSLHHQLHALVAESHNATELWGIEAEWLINNKLDVARLLECVNASGHAQHQLEACLLLLRIAHETCDEALAHRAYRSVFGLLPSASPKDRLALELVYQTTFGDTNKALRAIDALIKEIPSFEDASDRMMAARNAAVGLLIVGRPSEAIAVADRYRLWARELGLVTREFEFAALIVVCYIATEQFDEALSWFAKLSAPPDSRWLSLHRTLAIELAIWRRDYQKACELLQALEDAGYGKMARNNAYLCGYKLRIKQFEPSFVCTQAEFNQFLGVHLQTQRYISDDCFARALAEDLFRRGRFSEAARLLDDYLDSARRQSWVLPNSLNFLRERINVKLKGESAA